MFVTMVFVQQACICTLLVWHRSWFTQWRTHIVVPFLLSRLFIAYFSLRDRPFLGIMPLEWPSDPIKATMHALFVPLILGRQCLAFLLPERASTVVCLAHLVEVALSNGLRCSLELAQVPGQGQRYFQIIWNIREFFMHNSPLPSTYPLGMDIEFFTLSEQGSCIAFKTTLQVAVGYFIPMAVILAEESVSRKMFRIRRGYSETYTYPTSILILQYLFLIPFQAAVTFNAVVLVLHWAGF